MDYATASKTKLINFTDDELAEIVRIDEHEYPYDDGDGDPGYHYTWDCETCAAEAILNHRRYVELSKEPGAKPHYPKGGRYHSITARELKVHAIADFNGRPGTDGTESVECVGVDYMGDTIVAMWRRTNTDEDEFTVVYDADDNLRVFDPSPANWENPTD